MLYELLFGQVSMIHMNRANKPFEGMGHTREGEKRERANERVRTGSFRWSRKF